MLSGLFFGISIIFNFILLLRGLFCFFCVVYYVNLECLLVFFEFYCENYVYWCV